MCIYILMYMICIYMYKYVCIYTLYTFSIYTYMYIHVWMLDIGIGINPDREIDMYRAQRLPISRIIGEVLMFELCSESEITILVLV